ncbi:hypothetical protein [Desulfospira joergensenii]|uniref:hypothetical protein n=1 Tax=Desulfospira joergensenii TaxID=53329 RepID=UPI0003B5CC72|nr:hypothetical protein [Desulfospira joergensenii]
MKKMSQKIKFHDYPSFEDSTKVMRQIEKKKFFSSSGIVSILLVVAIGVTISSISGNIVFFIFMLFFLSAIMIFGAWFIRKSNANAQRKSYDANCIKRHGIFSNDNIVLDFEKTKTELDWTFFDKAIVGEKAIAIVKDTDFLGFADYMFDSENDWLEAKELINKKYVQQIAGKDAP